MFADLWNSLFGRKKTFELIPSDERLPSLWRGEPGKQKANLSVLDRADTSILMALCDQYWNYLLSAQNSDEQSAVVNSMVVDRAMEIIGDRGDEALAWARERLHHADYFAREAAARLISKLAGKKQLGAHRDKVAAELAKLALRPWEEDTKEVQANAMALGALEQIGGPICYDTMKRVLLSPYWDDDENQYEAAQILSKITKQNFMDMEDPVQAAKDWLRTQA